MNQLPLLEYEAESPTSPLFSSDQCCERRIAYANCSSALVYLRRDAAEIALCFHELAAGESDAETAARLRDAASEAQKAAESLSRSMLAMNSPRRGGASL